MVLSFVIFGGWRFKGYKAYRSLHVYLARRHVSLKIIPNKRYMLKNKRYQVSISE